MKRCVVFCFYHFNDIDHMAPVVWRMLAGGAEVICVILNPECEVEDDARFSFLLRSPNCRVMKLYELIPVPMAHWVFQLDKDGFGGMCRRYVRRLMRWMRMTVPPVKRLLAEWQPIAVVFEWGSTKGAGRREFYDAATELGIRRLCIPHGLNIFLNADPAPRRRRFPGRNPNSQKEYMGYEAFVYQSRFHMDYVISMGMDPAISMVLGSARFCPEWIEILGQIYSDFRTVEPVGDRLKVVMMLPHWHYNVDVAETLRAIDWLARRDDIYLVIKNHTRQEGKMPSDRGAELLRLPGCEIEDEVSSIPLVRWADVVVNFGSSIGLQALLDDTLLVNPSYLHANRTVFEEKGASLEIDSFDALRSAVEGFVRDGVPSNDEAAKSEVLKAVVFGGQDRFDVLSAYHALIVGERTPREFDTDLSAAFPVGDAPSVNAEAASGAR